MTKKAEIERLKQQVQDLEAQNRSLRRENERLVKKNERMRKKEEKRLQEIEEEEKQELAYFFIQQRRALGITRAELARVLGVSSSRILNYEKAEGRIESMRDLAARVKGLWKERKKNA